ncbi:carbohydrate binding domain-containing protein [uncultured Polaribacter sp.]|uniref:carbohydrate binding domain-containing protein n=1 Tax=uncultured Polaribacter sp. TaxID=174711 RepID=UPI002621B7E8|nr:carbohydrate binding domain-containing protein [uncultured Polaribacter sp.]
MKQIKTIFKAFIILVFVSACTDNENLEFLENIPAPTNISALLEITQDNSGLVTITPNADGAIFFDVFFGDLNEEPAKVEQGKSVSNIYAEGSYDLKIVAFNAVGDTTEFIQPLIVSFNAPQNLIVDIENDASTSKQVNITANADFATTFEFYSGEQGVTQPVLTGNIGDTINYQYVDAGVYDVRVVAKGGAIETTEFTASFEVTQILAPLTAAPNPSNRTAEDVVSIFSDAYTNVTLDELPTDWSVTNFEATTIENNNVWKLTNLDFLGIVTNYTNGIELSTMEKMHIDYWVPEGTTNGLSVKIVNTIDGGEGEASLGETIGGTWQSIELDITAFDEGDLSNKEKITQLLIDSDGVAGVVYIDNFYFYKESSLPSTFDDGLLTNGDFENGSDSWLVGVDDNSAAPVVTENGNTFYSVNVTNANPSEPFQVNVSQKLEIVQGNTYTLTFDAWSDRSRSIIAGIGLSGGAFTNDSQTVAITATRTTYTLTLSSAEFGAADARVLFDLNGENGMVNIDNVSLIRGLGNLLTNGNFENGSDSWLVGVDDNSAAPVVTENGNTFYSVNVTSANPSEPFQVNVSQKLEIIQGNTYTLTFDAWSDRDRSIIAGIGLSGGSFTNDSQTVGITATRTTYTLTLSSAEFGAADARVLFDLNGENGLVNIDDVSLSLN